ncbi:MAG: hypothetical protein CL910_07235 [Deltaproteobacteria bacterium]|jgi:hypothetical protein|nr:hypothetical protein [Deltaproteobacteria bacterium]
MAYRDHALRWTFRSDTPGSYQLIDPVWFGRSPAPAEGQMRSRYPEDLLRVIVRHESPTGRTLYSPPLELDMTQPEPEASWEAGN